ncbi:MAG: hypothetical protein B6D34_12955 [Candidatus Brocadia sp. UTAMX1]|nr:MAG: hypothetical protein B6D34_12955 [Candidatus Brocadia sp. UTAMX1]
MKTRESYFMKKSDELPETNNPNRSKKIIPALRSLAESWTSQACLYGTLIKSEISIRLMSAT